MHLNIFIVINIRLENLKTVSGINKGNPQAS
jgi:hypothetical protein